MMSHTGGFSCNAFEDIIHKGVENGHRFVGDTGIRVYLLED
jgi:hypothetical protein